MMNQIVVGSTNPVKVEAVRRALVRIWPQAAVVGVEVASGVAAQPTSDDDAIIGALNRARNAFALHPADLAIGIEGNTTELSHSMFTTAWVAVIDANGQVGLGSGGRFPLPTSVAAAIRNGGELGSMMDRLTDDHNTKHKQGAVGILTNGLVGRVDALEMAVICALCRWLAPGFYAEGEIYREVGK